MTNSVNVSGGSSGSINVNATSSTTNASATSASGSSSVETVNNAAWFWANIAKEWAIKMSGLVQGEDYSSKYWAQESKGYAEQAEEIIQSKDEILAELEQEGNTQIGLIEDAGTEQIGLVESSTDAQIERIEDAGDTQITNITNVSNTNIATINGLIGDAQSAASAAANSAQSASNSATSASNSSTSASNSANSAQTSATEAANSASSASDSATAAATSAQSAAGSATSASNSATAASGSASSAQSSATSASNSASSASNSATNASNSATSAASSASAAATSEDNAEIWAEGTDEEVQALGGIHSAKGWADVSSAGQIQADWEETDTTSKAYIRNKPSNFASSVSELTDVDLTGLSNGDVLVYDSTTQEWKAEAQSGGGTWGSITGTLSNQTDLQNALNSKADSSSIGNGTVTFTQGGVTKGTITMNQSSNTTIALEQGGGVAEIDLSNYQKTIEAGDNITVKQPVTIRVPEGYTQLERISSSSGACCIDTGLIGEIQWEIDVVGTSPYPTKRALIATDGNGSSFFGQLSSTYWATNGGNTSVPITTRIKLIIDFTATSCSGTINDTPFSYTDGGSLTTNWVLFGTSNYGSKLYGHLYSAIARRNGLVVFDGVPAKRDSDDKVGLYDVVSGNFFASATDTDFTAGTAESSNAVVSANVGNGTLTISRYGTTLATFTANQTGNATANMSNPAIQPKEIGTSSILNSSTSKPINSLLYCGNDNLVHSYTETNVPISMAYGMFVNNSQLSANSLVTYYYKGEKLSWTVPSALRNFTSKHKVWAKCTYPDSSGNVYFVSLYDQNGSTNELQGGYTYYYLGCANSTTTVALDVTGSHFLSINADGKLTHIDGIEIEQPESGGSSRNIGEIVASTIPLTDAGLHLLDGALISGSGSYSEFVDYIAGLVTDYPNLFDTEANWQSAVTQYGVCEKFVYDSTNNTVRLPKYGNQIYTGGTVPVLGNGMSVGLTTNTNNLGTLGISTDAATNRTYAYAHTPATLPATLNSPYLTNVDKTAVGITTDATKSGIISNPEDISMDCYYYIVVATSTKTDIQVDIDEIATDLNGKADTDFSNVTDVAKIAMANASMPSNTYEDLTLGASGTTYTAPANGWFTVRISSTGGTGIAYVTLNSSELLTTRDSNYHPSNSTSIGLYCSIPVKKGSVVTVNYSVMSTVSNKTLRFIYAEGSKSEAN